MWFILFFFKGACCPDGEDDALVVGLHCKLAGEVEQGEDRAEQGQGGDKGAQVRNRRLIKAWFGIL